jgi:4-hydroxybenzoate polyprenyltransferase
MHEHVTRNQIRWQVGAAGLAKTLTLCIVEARPVVQVMFLLRFGAGVALAGGDELLRVLAGFICWACATFFTYLINGVADIVEDRVNGSRRPIARGDLDPEVAAVVAWAAAVLAILLGFALGLTTGLLVVAFVACGYVYSGRPFYFKRFTGTTVAVVLLAGGLTYAAGYEVGVGPNGGIASVPLVLFGTAMSLWMGLVGALAKDMPDAAGDRAAGRLTVACRWGERRVRQIVAIAATCVGSLFLLAALRYAPGLLMPALVVQGGGCAVAVLAMSRRTADTRARLPYRAFMITQYAAHLSLFSVLI